MDENVHKAVLELNPIQARKLIVWCARRHVPASPSAALDAVNAADSYTKGEMTYGNMREFHNDAINFYSKTHTGNRPWRREVSASEVTNVALLAKLCTVDDNHIQIAVQDAVYVLHAIEPFDEVLAMVLEQIKELKNEN